MRVSYAPEDIDARLRELGRLSEGIHPATPRVDMSPEAIDLRLRQTSDLRAACLALARIGAEDKDAL